MQAFQVSRSVWIIQNAAADSTDHWKLPPGNGTHHYLPGNGTQHYLPATSNPFLCDDEIHIQHPPARQMLLIHGVWVPVSPCRSSFAVCLQKSGIYVIIQNPQRTGKGLSCVHAQAEIPRWVRITKSTHAVRFLFCTLLIPLHPRITAWMLSFSCALMNWDAKIYWWVSGEVELQDGNPTHVLRSNVC